MDSVCYSFHTLFFFKNANYEFDMHLNHEICIMELLTEG